MTAGLDQLDALDAIPFENVFADWVRDHETELVDMNREQLDKGLDATGNDLGEYSSTKYKGRKKPVDLLLTGAFRGSFGVDPVTGGFVSNATDSKYVFLQKKYGPEIVGTPDDKLEEIGESVKDTFIDEIHRRL